MNIFLLFLILYFYNGNSLIFTQWKNSIKVTYGVSNTQLYNKASFDNNGLKNKIIIPFLIKTSYFVGLNERKVTLPLPLRIFNAKMRNMQSNGLIRLIRPTNIIPTVFLGLTSGYIMNPSISNLIHNKQFLISNFITLIVMCNSMIINDLFDINVDKKNSNSRPLVTGEIKLRDARIISIFLFGLSQFLNYNFINKDLTFITNIANIVSITYTPILKRIPFIKNISCAALISLCIFFSGLIAIPNGIINKNIILLCIAYQLIFLGSLGTELLLDICDIEGDRENNIRTIPVLFGKEFTLNFVNNITIFNILWNVLSLTYLYDFKRSVILMVLVSPLLYNLKNIKKFGYSKEIIKQTISQTIYPMVYTISYLCFLAETI
jgi:4-hydroxybenzoate polyprenyltransferase